MIERVTASSIALGRQAIQQVEELDNSLDSIRMDVTEWELQRDDLRAGLVNQELLKAEVRAMGGVLEELARAIAPAVGLPGAGIALAELRERLTMCERRVRHLESAPSASQSTSLPPPSSDAGLAPPDPAAPRAPASALFDYAGFERRFRGTPEDVSAMLDERYGELLQGHPPVLDIGCGRAELVALLAGRGVAAIGVDTDPSMVADAREQGLEVVQADALQFLRDQAPGTFGAIVATHILEHLELDPLIELLELSQSRLRPGGIFIAETPNPASLIVLGNAYILDPTHVRPLHPKLLEFLCEASGFRSLEVRFFAPATGFQLDLIADPDAPPWVSQINRALHQLNTVLFGPQDFAIVARSGAADDRDRPGPTAQ
jgi:SAM-dependent methyltransferase